VIENVFKKPIPRKTTVRDLVVTKDDPMDTIESETDKLRAKLESLKLQLKEAKQNADNRASEEEKSFLEKVSQMEMAERASMEYDETPDNSE
jgi:phosphoenolpyruvate-protein kinase (PTS system EI component)